MSYPSYHLATGAYGEVKVMPLLLANELTSTLEQWFQDCKFHHLSISKLSEEIYNTPLQVEFTYSMRTLPLRNFQEVNQNVRMETDLLNYHRLIKIVHKFIEVFYKDFLVLTEKKQGNEIGTFEAHVNELCKKFHSKSFSEKLKIIESNLELKSPLDGLLQMNRVRNCLEHRLGIVGEKDCDAGKDYMSIQWVYPTVTSSEGNLSPLSNIIVTPSEGISFVREAREFRLKERVEFDFDDNYKCIYTILNCFKCAIDALYEKISIDQDKTPMIIRNFDGVRNK